MRISLSFMKKIGFTRYPLPGRYDPLNMENIKYPFDRMFFFYDKKKRVVTLKIKGTYHDCSTPDKLLSSVIFYGINIGREQKIDEIKKVLEIRGGEWNVNSMWPPVNGW